MLELRQLRPTSTGPSTAKRRSPSPFRGGFAVAVSHANGLTLATLDKRLADAGPQLGAATLLL
jgi:hypothetical protein